MHNPVKVYSSCSRVIVFEAAFREEESRYVPERSYFGHVSFIATSTLRMQLANSGVLTPCMENRVKPRNSGFQVTQMSRYSHLQCSNFKHVSNSALFENSFIYTKQVTEGSGF